MTREHVDLELDGAATLLLEVRISPDGALQLESDDGVTLNCTKEADSVLHENALDCARDGD
jgi:hypothetical protein